MDRRFVKGVNQGVAPDFTPVHSQVREAIAGGGEIEAGVVLLSERQFSV